MRTGTKPSELRHGSSRNPTRAATMALSQDIQLNINDKQYSITIEPRVSLLDALRENLGLTGTKKGCNQGACGACTVIIDGERKLSCLTLAYQTVGSKITTIEGLVDNSILQFFEDNDGFQCGYCTPGQICSAVAMCHEFKAGVPSSVTPSPAKVTSSGTPSLTEEEIKERMSGNLCRCGAYNGIVDAIAGYAKHTNAESQ